jgi:hypothetical protein
VTAQDVVEVGAYGFQFVDEELLLRLEVAEPKREMGGRRDGAHGTDRFVLDRAQLEVAASLVLGEAWQAVELLDFFDGEDRKAPRLCRHARHTGAPMGTLCCREEAVCSVPLLFSGEHVSRRLDILEVASSEIKRMPAKSLSMRQAVCHADAAIFSSGQQGRS